MTNRLCIQACLVLLACNAPPTPGSPSGEPYVKGPVETITHHATASNVLVRAGPGSLEPCGISATLDAETRYFYRNADGVVMASSLKDIAIGDTVEVYVEGAIAESCPVQGRASEIVLIRRP